VDLAPPGKASIALNRGAKRFKVYRHNEADAATLANDTVVRLLMIIGERCGPRPWTDLVTFDTQSQRFVTYGRETERSSYLSLAEDQPRISVGLELIRRDCCGFEPPINAIFRRLSTRAVQHVTLTDNRINSIHVDQHGVICGRNADGTESLRSWPPAYFLVTSRQTAWGPRVIIVSSNSF